MRGFWVKCSPDSPRSEAVKTRAKRGNPETKKHTQLITAIHKIITSGKPGHPGTGKTTMATTICHANAGRGEEASLHIVL
jgi:MoxR-like ATPase